MELRHSIEVLFFLLHKSIKYYLTTLIYYRNAARYLLIELCVNRWKISDITVLWLSWWINDIIIGDRLIILDWHNIEFFISYPCLHEASIYIKLLKCFSVRDDFMVVLIHLILSLVINWLIHLKFKIIISKNMVNTQVEKLQ